MLCYFQNPFIDDEAEEVTVLSDSDEQKESLDGKQIDSEWSFIQ